MDILVGKVSEATTGSGGANPPGTLVGTLLGVRPSRRGARSRLASGNERRRLTTRPDPPRSIVITLLIEDTTALQGKLEPGVTRMAVRRLPASR